ncbi:hypothetical protein J6590_098408 [Homalodisca vitripennis]|nr:hypothetical protein J6590_098408 [Homalodisca vitripennis]
MMNENLGGSSCACIQAYQPKNLYNAVFHGVLDQQSGTQAGAYQTTNFSYAVFHGVLDQQSGTQAGAYQTTNFSYAVFHGVLDQQSGTQAGAYHNEFQQCCLPWSLGPAERHTGRDVSQRISAMLSPMESWTSRAAHRQGRITTNFSYAVSHGVLDQQSGTQAGAYHNEFQQCCLPWSLGPAERHTGRSVTKNFSYAVFHGVLDQQSGTQAGAYQTTNFSNAVSHGVLDQQSGTQAGAYHN